MVSNFVHTATKLLCLNNISNSKTFSPPSTSTINRPFGRAEVFRMSRLSYLEIFLRKYTFLWCINTKSETLPCSAPGSDNPDEYATNRPHGKRHFQNQTSYKILYHNVQCIIMTFSLTTTLNQIRMDQLLL